MKTQKIKLFKTWHKLLIAGIWVGAFVWLAVEIHPIKTWIDVAVASGFSSFATAFPYLFLHNYLARKAGIPLAAGGAGLDDDQDGFHYWYGELCYGEGHTPCFRDDRD